MVHLCRNQVVGIWQKPTSKMFEKPLWKTDILSKDAGHRHKWNIGRVGELSVSHLLLVISYQLLVNSYSSLVTISSIWLLVTSCWLLITSNQLLVDEIYEISKPFSKAINFQCICDDVIPKTHFRKMLFCLFHYINWRFWNILVNYLSESFNKTLD